MKARNPRLRNGRFEDSAARLLLLLAGLTSCAPSVPPGSRRVGDARPPPPPGATSPGAGRAPIEPPEALGDGFLLHCDDASPIRTSRGAAGSSLLGISAPSPPPDSRTKTVVHRYRARPLRGAPALPPAIVDALDAGDLTLDTCVEKERDERMVLLTVTVDADGRVVSVAAPEDRGRLDRCLMARLCELRGAPSAVETKGETKAVIPLAIKPVIALNGTTVADLPAVSIVSARVHSMQTGPREDEEQVAMRDAMISLMTQAATVCRRAPLAWPGVQATFEIGFTPHSTVPPTVSFGEIARGDPPLDEALLQCVTDALAGRRMPGMWYSGSMTLRVTWDP
jgi:hypothetical protein